MTLFIGIRSIIMNHDHKVFYRPIDRSVKYCFIYILKIVNFKNFKFKNEIKL